MTLEEFLSLWPAWVALAISGLFALNKLIEESGKFAAFLGKWALKIHRRALARHHVDLQAAEFSQAITNALESARRAWLSDENEALRALDQRLEAVSGVTSQQARDIKELRFQLRCMTAYTEYESVWHGRLLRLISSAGNGHVRVEDLPPHVNFYEFEARYRDNTSWRDWSLG